MTFKKHLDPAEPICPVCGEELTIVAIHGFAPFVNDIHCTCKCGVKVKITIPMKK